jgi:alkylation response protein AidB-like acyl-CoA dehydrogenase
MIDRRAIDRSCLPGVEEQTMLRDSLRGLLETHWPPADAVFSGRDPERLATIWDRLAEQGVVALGADPALGGVRELTIAMEELGRAACPAPLLGAALANLALGGRADDAAATFLDRLHGGAVRVCWSFGDRDPSPGLGSVTRQRDGTLSGTLRFIDSIVGATHLIVVPTIGADAGLAILAADGNAVVIEPTRVLGADGLGEVRLSSARASFLPLAETELVDLLRIARLAVLARGYGAARRAFEMAVEYAKERRQFGQPIGRFQAIQHKLANNCIALEGVRLTVEHAAESFDLGLDAWCYFTAAAVAFGGPALRQASLETQHAFGAIGYAEEHELPRHFKRAHVDALLFGGAQAARRELATHLLDGNERTLPEYDLGADGNAFRVEVREWLQRHWSGVRKEGFDARSFHDREFDASFARDLGATGWLGLGWPRAFGGQERSPLEQLAFMEVMERAEAPRVGAAVQANALMMFGTPAQQERYLPEILRGEVMHGMGYSEPGAGSDLASLRTSAVLERDERGEHWVINGQKIWTTTYWGQYMFLAARTDRDAKPVHAGISMFVVPMDAPGITIKPATTMYDGSFANVFYDDVRIPSDALVGPLNGGWKVLTDALATERGLVGGGIVLKVVHGFELLCTELRGESADMPRRAADPLVRERVATLAAEIEVGRRLMIRCAELARDGTTPAEVGAMSKVFSGELMERFYEAALDLLGPRAALSQGAPGALRNGRFEQGLRHSLMWVISIGTNEIQRSLIAQRGLGLPR